MSIQLTIEVVDIDWQRRNGKSLDEDYAIGASVLGTFHVKIQYEDAIYPAYYLIKQCPDCALVPLDARKHHTLDDAKAACQQTYRTVVLSAIVLKREDFD